MKYLIVGLGNIGPEYELTRHNAGFLSLDRYADANKIKFKTSRLAQVAETKYRGRMLNLVKPTTYMNLSGKAVHYWYQKLQVPLENLLVIVDDIALPFGKLRLRAKGSSANHNGLENIEQSLGTQAYPRLRIGIGSEFNHGEQIDYVLSRFDKEEFKKLDEILKITCDIINSFVTVGIAKTMSHFNRNEGGKELKKEMNET